MRAHLYDFDAGFRTPSVGLIAGVDEAGLKEIVAAVGRINPKVYKLQELTGDM